MGETGCGKTRLIRFMCDLAAQGCKQGGKDVTNMLIMKVRFVGILGQLIIPLNNTRFMVAQQKMTL